MDEIVIGEKKFRLLISLQKIQQSVLQIAKAINNDFKHTEIIFISVLNGAFMFTADLMKHISVPCKVCFIKVKSYDGTNSTGKVQELIGLDEDIKNKTVILLEDIVDSGLTLKSIVHKLKEAKPACIKIAALFFKPEAYKGNYKIDYKGIDISDKFVVGYGLDYNGLGRNLNHLYQLDSN